MLCVRPCTMTNLCTVFDSGLFLKTMCPLFPKQYKGAIAVQIGRPLPNCIPMDGSYHFRFVFYILTTKKYGRFWAQQKPKKDWNRKGCQQSTLRRTFSFVMSTPDETPVIANAGIAGVAPEVAVVVTFAGVVAPVPARSVPRSGLNPVARIFIARAMQN